jgi:Poly(R)-hydroxyalkanoic acid synthase subunit (PHA_synth_III_E)
VEENLKDNREELSSKNSAPVSEQQKQQEKIADVINNWSELFKLPTIGPFYAFSQELDPFAQRLSDISQTVLRLQINLNEYWIQIRNAYIQAISEISEKAPKQYNSKEDFENYRKVAIEAFEDTFTRLFTSKEFPAIYNKVSSDQMDLLRYVQSIVEKSFQSLNLPTRSEIDELTKDIHSLKRTVHELKRKLALTTSSTENHKEEGKLS